MDTFGFTWYKGLCELPKLYVPEIPLVAFLWTEVAGFKGFVKGGSKSKKKKPADAADSDSSEEEKAMEALGPKQDSPCINSERAPHLLQVLPVKHWFSITRDRKYQPIFVILSCVVHPGIHQPKEAWWLLFEQSFQALRAERKHRDWDFNQRSWFPWKTNALDFHRVDIFSQMRLSNST